MLAVIEITKWPSLCITANYTNTMCIPAVHIVSLLNIVKDMHCLFTSLPIAIEGQCVW